MTENISIVILGENHEIIRNLQTDLDELGFKSISGKFPNADPESILQQHPDAILLDLTTGDCDSLIIDKLLTYDKALSEEIAFVVLVSENTIDKLPLDYRFADIITTPYDINELGYRIRRVIHFHHKESSNDTIHVGNLAISPSQYEVKVDNQPISLRYKEYQLFKYLITHPNRVLTRKELLADIWGPHFKSDSRTVDVHVRRVREKIGDTSNKYIKTVRGVGYVFRFNDN